MFLSAIFVVLAADMVLLNGVIITLDQKNSVVQALAIKNGRIVAVGANGEIKETIGERTVVIDLEGRVVVPGFIDAHQHLSTVPDIVGEVDCGPEHVGSISDIIGRVREVACGKRVGEWVRAGGYDEYRLLEKRHPNRWDLDGATTEHPVVLFHSSGHMAVVNSKALELMGITKDTKDPVGGKIERDPASGEPNGILFESAIYPLLGIFGVQPIIPPLTREKRVEIMKRKMEEYVKAGITSVVDAAVNPEGLGAYCELFRRGELAVRVYMALTYDCLPELKKLNIASGFGNEWLKIGGIKIFADGAFAGKTAYLSKPYSDRSDYYGILAIPPEEIERRILDIHRAGFQVFIHANGDKAVEMVLDAFEKALKEFPRKDHRHRIEHCSVVRPELVEKVKRLGVLPVLFAAYPYWYGDKLVSAYGSERLPWLIAYRSFLDRDVKVASHSDHPVSPFRPLLGIHSIVNRTTMEGRPFGLEQRVSVEEALKTYTVYAAYSTFEENIKGSLEPGKLADMVVLSENPLSIPAEKIKDVEVEMTIIGGKIVYEKHRKRA